MKEGYFVSEAAKTYLIRERTSLLVTLRCFYIRTLLKPFCEPDVPNKS